MSIILYPGMMNNHIFSKMRDELLSDTNIFLVINWVQTQAYTTGYAS